MAKTLKWKDFIVSTVISNTGLDAKQGSEIYNTRDKLYLKSADEVAVLPKSMRVKAMTDYAILNGGTQSDTGIRNPKGDIATYYTLRSSTNNHSGCMDIIDVVGAKNYLNVNAEYLCMAPSMQLNLKSVVEAKKLNDNLFKIEEVKDGNGNTLYHTMAFGEMPQNVDSENHDKIAKAFDRKKVVFTGKEYDGYIDKNTIEKNKEFIYNGQKYVRVKSRIHIVYGEYNNTYGYYSYKDDSKSAAFGDYEFVKVEPIKHIIENFDELPKDLNPNGTGKAETIKLTTEDLIKAPCFYPYESEKNNTLYQNSTIRGYLNGINVNNIKENGISLYSATAGGDYTGKGLIDNIYGEIPNEYFLTEGKKKEDKVMEK